ncbi:uncharacterized protein LOC110383788 [Helicoverpa armigera]|uniref:uncharacterized protein LOC110383788 n=1 Tax=Helicoverpa armigera TaxID=29058 RepID=UPI002112E650|nr:uncharacterized protein LOC110383788 [Helicoverpa armigera]
MTRLFCICLSVCAFAGWSDAVSTKMDFAGDEIVATVTNSTKVEDEDVEVQHTIVLSTKLKNNNRRGLHGSSEGDTGTLSYNIGKKEAKEDSGEVPVVNGYKSVETTQIRTPDTRIRNRAKIYPESTFINRNVRDELDIYPNYITNPSQWQPSSFYNNINWMAQEVPNREYNTGWKVSRPAYQTPGKFHRGITDDGLKEFYCKKCRELNGQGMRCPPASQRRNSWLYETTTPKIKLDGKLAKLN